MANRKISDFSLLTTATGLEQVSLIFGNQNYRMTLNTFKSILTKQDVGLGNVSNTSDADKPVSTAVLTALLSKADVNHTHTLTIDDIPGLMTALAGKSNFGHTHVSSEISGLDLSLAGKAALGHTHAIDDISLLAQTLSMKAETGHVHDMTTIAGLSAALAGKAAVSHVHDMSSISGLADSLATMQTSLAGKSAIGHGHAIADISGLSTIITNLQTAVTNLQAGGGGGTVDLTAINAEITALTTLVQSHSVLIAGKASQIDLDTLTDLVNQINQLKASQISLDALTDTVNAINVLKADITSLTALSDIVNGITPGITGNGIITDMVALSDAISAIGTGGGGGGGINVAGTGLLKTTNNILTLAAAGTDYMSPSAENNFTKPQKVSTTNKVQPASGTVSWDLDTHQVIRIELTSNVTNFNIQNLDLTRIGFDYKVVIIHKGGDLVFPANVKFPDGAAPALTLINNKIDTFSFMVESFDGVTPYLYCVGYALNM
jgi:Phage tail repeat like